MVVISLRADSCFFSLSLRLYHVVAGRALDGISIADTLSHSFLSVSLPILTLARRTANRHSMKLNYSLKSR